MATYTFATFSELKEYPNPVPGDSAIMASYNTIGDGGGGEFFFKTGGQLPPNNDGTVVQPTVGSGRWIRIFSGAVNIKWFGAKTVAQAPNFDSKPSIQAAIDNAIFNEVFIPAGTYYIASTVEIKDKPNLKIYGEGKASVIRCNGITIFSILSSTYNPDTGSQNLVTGNEIKDLVLKGKVNANDPPSANSIGINLLGVTNGIIERVYFSGLDKVVNQDQAESYVFKNITPVSLENIYSDPPQNTILAYTDDCNYIIYSNGLNRRSNDNIYTEIVGRARTSEIELHATTSDVPGQSGSHDGASISECIFFECTKNNIYIEQAIWSSITANKLFVAGSDSIKLTNAARCSITGNLIAYPGNLKGEQNPQGEYAWGNGLYLYYTAGAPKYGYCTVVGNVIDRPSKDGIKIEACDAITVADNIITSPNDTVRHKFDLVANKYSGINVINSKNFNITRNVVHPYRGDSNYAVTWKADVEIDNKSFGSVLHDATFESKGVLNQSQNVIISSGFDDYEEKEIPTVAQLSSKVLGFRVGANSWLGNAAGGVAIPGLSDNNTVSPAIPLNLVNNYQNKCIQVNFPNTLYGTPPVVKTSWIYSGQASVLNAGEYATFSLWAKKEFNDIGPTILSLEISTSTTAYPNIPARKVIYLDDKWRRYFVTMQQPSTAQNENEVPQIKIISSDQEAKTAYFTAIQVTNTKNLLPTLNRICFDSAPPVDNSGFWYKGDIIRNSNPTVASNVVAEGWICLTTGISVAGQWEALKA